MRVRVALLTVALLLVAATTAEASPVDTVNDTSKTVFDKGCAHVHDVFCMVQPAPVRDPIEPCTCDPID